jgi:RNA polymerase sigma factor (sigma-70 family)
MEARAPEQLKAPRGLTGEKLAIYLRIPPDIDCVPDPSFDAASAADRFFGSSAIHVSVPQWFSPPDMRSVQPRERAMATRLSTEQEVLLFLRYNYARWRLRKLIAEQINRRCLSRALEMVQWYTRVLQCCSEIARANMPLVVSMAKRMTIPFVDFTELCSEGNMALLRSINKFDIRRGYKFSTYACRAILKSFRRLAAKHGRYRRHFPVELDLDMQKSDNDDNRRSQQWDDSVQTLRQILACNLASMTDIERRIVTLRFGMINGNPDRMTLAQIGKEVGFSNERVRQILHGSLRKLRESLQKTLAAG